MTINDGVLLVKLFVCDCVVVQVFMCVCAPASSPSIWMGIVVISCRHIKAKKNIVRDFRSLPQFPSFVHGAQLPTSWRIICHLFFHFPFDFCSFCHRRIRMAMTSIDIIHKFYCFMPGICHQKKISWYMLLVQLINVMFGRNRVVWNGNDEAKTRTPLPLLFFSSHFSLSLIGHWLIFFSIRIKTNFNARWTCNNWRL